MLFQAYAKIHKFKKTIGIAPDPSLPEKKSTLLDATRDAAAIVAKQQNETAMACLTMAFTNESLLGLIY